MVCEHCGKEMIKVGVLTEKEREDFIYVNEKFNCTQMALNNDVIKDLEFTDGQVFEYFKASYDQLAQANYLKYIFERDLKKRIGLNPMENITIDFISNEIFIHPKEENK